jgi:hypothetical protein
VSFHTSGECPLEARQVGNSKYRAATVVQRLHVRGITQTIKLTASVPSPARAGESFQVKGVSSAGFPVEYESATPSVCYAFGYQIGLAAGGTCTIAATASGSDTYEPARTELTFQVLKQPQRVTLSPAPSSARVGGAPFALSAEASSGLPVVLATLTPMICKLEGSEVSPVGPGTCTIKASQAGSSYWEEAPQVEQSFKVGKALQRISFQTLVPNEVVLGEGPFAVAAVSSSGLPIKLSSATPSTCSLEATDVHLVAAGTCTIDANQPGSGYYEEAPQVVDSFTIAKRPQIVRFISNAPESATVRGAPYLAAATSSSDLPVIFSTSGTSVCEAEGATIQFIGPGVCVIDAAQAGDAEFAPATGAQQLIRVLPAPAPLLTTVPGNPLSSPFGSMSDSSFRLLDAPSVSPTSGAITFSASVVQPGTFSWRLTFRDGSFGVLATSTSKCRADEEQLYGACRPRYIVFGTGTLAVASPSVPNGTVTFTVSPGRAAQSALQRASRLRRTLAVTASLSFQSSLGGTPVTHRESVADSLRSKRRSRPDSRYPPRSASIRQ